MKTFKNSTAQRVQPAPIYLQTFRIPLPIIFCVEKYTLEIQNLKDWLTLQPSKVLEMLTHKESELKVSLNEGVHILLPRIRHSSSSSSQKCGPPPFLMPCVVDVQRLIKLTDTSSAPPHLTLRKETFHENSCNFVTKKTENVQTSLI